MIGIIPEVHCEWDGEQISKYLSIFASETTSWIRPLGASPMDESAVGLAFLLVLFGYVCSLSLFPNTTFCGGGRSSGDSVTNDHYLFLLGPDGQTTARNNANGGGLSRRGVRGNGLRLLTTEEVETLPTREY